MIASLAMCLRYSLELGEVADKLEQAIAGTLDKGLRTPDIMSPGMQKVGTSEMGAAVRDALQEVLAR
jgi:3-isopropylmalate dehydrogenase